jgi:predicted RecA/RadA family phage recombinase
MAANHIQPGKVLELTAPAGGVVSGTPYLVGALFVVALTTAAAAASFRAATDEAWELPKATGQAWTEGAALYWDDTAKKVTTTSAGNTKIGCAIAAAASGDTVGKVLLNGAV